MLPHMIRLMPFLNSDGKITRLRVSVPRIDALLDGGRYVLEEDLPARSGQELRAHRAPRLKTLVRLALRCRSAEELGLKLRRRYEQQRRQGARQAEAEAEMLAAQDL